MAANVAIELIDNAGDLSSFVGLGVKLYRKAKEGAPKQTIRRGMTNLDQALAIVEKHREVFPQEVALKLVREHKTLHKEATDLETEINQRVPIMRRIFSSTGSRLRAKADKWEESTSLLIFRTRTTSLTYRYKFVEEQVSCEETADASLSSSPFTDAHAVTTEGARGTNIAGCSHMPGITEAGPSTVAEEQIMPTSDITSVSDNPWEHEQDTS